MSYLHLLLPPLARFDDAPALRRLLARGDRLPNAVPGRETALREVFQLPGASLPVAALLREHFAHDAGENIWLCADPAYVRVETSGARLLVCGNELQLTSEEAESLAQPLRPLFGDAGAPLEITTPSQWSLHLAGGTQPPAFVSADEALGANLLEYLPQGDAGRRWRALFNEAQIVLHSHPVNAARRERGAMPVNALWFWGAGALPMWVKSSLGRLVSDDALARALARRAVVKISPLALDVLEELPRGSQALFDLALLDAAQIETAWLPRIARAQRPGIVLHVAFASGERYRVKRWHRWRLWRRSVLSPLPHAGEG